MYSTMVAMCRLKDYNGFEGNDNVTDIYDRRVQIEASCQRYEDAKSLQKSGRWSGAMYIAGYAVECALKALICYEGCTNNLKNTQIYRQGVKGAKLHDLRLLFDALSPGFRKAILANENLKGAWSTVVGLWRMEELRYGNTLGRKKDCERFLEAVELLHSTILGRQRGFL